MEARAVPAMLGTHFTTLSTILPQTQNSGSIGDLGDISLQSPRLWYMELYSPWEMGSFEVPGQLWGVQS